VPRGRAPGAIGDGIECYRCDILGDIVHFRPGERLGLRAGGPRSARAPDRLGGSRSHNGGNRTASDPATPKGDEYASLPLHSAVVT